MDARIKKCKQCKDMNIKACSEVVCGYGNIMSPVFFVGQSAGTSCMSTQIPFSGGSGYLIDIALRMAGLKRYQVFMTNVVHCHPPGNRKSTADEVYNCEGFLNWELDLVYPKLVVAMGKDAQDWFKKYLKIESAKFELLNVVHPAYIFRYSWKGALKWANEVSTAIKPFIEYF